MHFLRSLLLLALYSLVPQAHAQKPEHIPWKNWQLLPAAYYRQQAVLWRAVLVKAPGNADAWLNYYTANRHAEAGEGENGMVDREAPHLAHSDSILNAMERYVPGTFECLLVKWENGHNDLGLLPCLEKAHAMAPKRPEPYWGLIPAYERMGRDSLRDALCKAYLQLRDLPPDLLNYGYNLLMGTQPDAVLFTPGGDIGMAILVVQHGMGIRDDVHVLCLDLMQAKDHREHEFRILHVPGLTPDPVAGDPGLARYRQHIIAHVAAALPGSPVYVALSVGDPYTRPIHKALHLTGLAYRYSTESFDPLPELIDNYVSRYALYNLAHPAAEQGDIAANMVHRLNADYLPSLYAVIDHYATGGDEAAVAKFKAMARQVAADAGRSGEFSAHFAK